MCNVQGLPGKAPTLYRRLGAAGEAAVHLLSRMLNFEPARRCSAEEALEHEYFNDLEINRQSTRAPLCINLLALLSPRTMPTCRPGVGFTGYC